MKVLDLFSGIGGFSLGLERAGMETVAFCEQDEFCQKILNKHWKDIGVYNDVRTITTEYDGTVDLICGGFPCQPFSVAGKQKGEADDRHLWPAMLECVKHYKPRWVIGENVSGFVSMALDDVLSDLESEGYECETFILPACAVNAPHRRDRVWVIAHASDSRCNDGRDNRKKRHVQENIKREFEENKPEWKGRKFRVSEDTIVTSDPMCERQGGGESTRNETKGREKVMSWGCLERSGWGYWKECLPTPRICRGDDGISDRSHRLRALGNAVVPQIPELIGRAIMEIENNEP